jgi:hypothetical protein
MYSLIVRPGVGRSFVQLSEKLCFGKGREGLLCMM